MRHRWLAARIDRNYERIFAVVTGAGLLAILGGVLIVAVSVTG